MSENCPICGQPVAQPVMRSVTDVGSLGYSVGDRVRHEGRASSSLASDIGEGMVTDIAPGPHGKMSVHVTFDYVSPRSGNPSIGIYDGLWFGMYPDELKKLPAPR